MFCNKALLYLSCYGFESNPAFTVDFSIRGAYVGYIIYLKVLETLNREFFPAFCSNGSSPEAGVEAAAQS